MTGYKKFPIVISNNLLKVLKELGVKHPENVTECYQRGKTRTVVIESGDAGKPDYLRVEQKFTDLDWQLAYAMAGLPARHEVIQWADDMEVLKDYVQAESGEVISDETFMTIGVLLRYEQMREESNPPHNIVVAYRRIQAITECAAEEMAHGVKQG